jgi:hypothetical protein
MLYYPILRLKKGEAKAIASLKYGTRATIRPVLVIPPVGAVLVTQEEQQRGITEEVKLGRKSENHAPTFIKNLLTALNESEDLIYYLDAKSSKLSLPRLRQMLVSIKDTPVMPRPVIYLSDYRSYWQLFNDVFGFPEAVMLRLNSSQVADPTTVAAVQQLYQELELRSTEFVIMLDAGDVSGADVSLYAPSIAAMCSSLQKAIPKAQCIVAGGGYPSSVSRITPWKQYEFERKCWTLWKKVHQWNNAVDFADYGPMSAVVLEEAAQRGAPKVRYTLADDFLLYQGVVKTKGSKTGAGQIRSLVPPPSPSEQYQRISEEIATHKHYPGPGFSWGDRHINECTDPSFSKRGNPTTWVRVNVSHHIEHVVTALASRF